MEQRSPEWHAERAGKATASRIADVVARTKSGYGASRKNYAAQLVTERLTGQTESSYVNAAMQHGIDTESEARDAYAFSTDAEVSEIAFVPHPTIEMSGASPDGMVGNDGLVEIKCPNSAQHIETLLTGKVPDKYVIQMQWQMACTGRKWCDFVSYDNRLPGAMHLFIHRVNRDDERISELESEVSKFLVEVGKTVAILKAKYELKEAA